MKKINTLIICLIIFLTIFIILFFFRLKEEIEKCNENPFQRFFNFPEGLRARCFCVDSNYNSSSDLNPESFIFFDEYGWGIKKNRN